MFENLKKQIALQLIKFTILYKTWKEAREIAKAYNQDLPVSKKATKLLKIYSRQISMGLIILGSCILVTIGTIYTVDYLKKTEPQRKAAALAKKEKLLNEKKAALARKVENERRQDSIKKVESIRKNDSIKEAAIALQSRRDSIKNDSIAKVKVVEKTVVKTTPDSTNNSKEVKRINETVANSESDSVGEGNKLVVDKKESAKSDEQLSFFGKIGQFIAKLNYKTEKSVKAQRPVAQSTIETVSKVSNTATIDYPNTSKVNDSFVSKSIVTKQPVKSTFRADYYVIIANKATRMLYLVKQNASLEWVLEKEYPIAIGAGLSGPKIAAGDKRTPEGIYFILVEKHKNELTEIYGPLAYVLNYPNEEDKREGRTGQGIWIHGTEGDGEPVPTKGCLSLKNSMMVELEKYIKDGKGTPVVIVNDSSSKDIVSVVDYEKVNKKRADVYLTQEKLLADINVFLQSWVVAWESRDINKYSVYYSEREFNSQGMKWSAWKEKKIQTFQAYSTINVDISNVKLTDWAESSVEVKFLQNYRSDQKYFENGKKLFLEKDSLSWKITREITIPKEEILL